MVGLGRLANDGASFVPIAVPPTCRKSLLSNSKLFVVNTRCRSLQIDALVGFSNGFLCLNRYFPTAVIPSLFGILVYMLVTSNVASIDFSGNWRFLKRFNKWLLSLK